MRTEQEIEKRLKELYTEIENDQKKKGKTTEWRLSYMTALAWVMERL